MQPEVLGASLVPNIPWVYDPRIQTTGDLVGAPKMAFASGPCGLDFDHHTNFDDLFRGTMEERTGAFGNTAMGNYP